MKPNFFYFLFFSGVVTFSSCTKAEDEPLSPTSREESGAKTTLSLVAQISQSHEMDEILRLSNALVAEPFETGYAAYLHSQPILNSEQDVLDFYSKVFVNESAVMEQLSEIRIHLFSLGQAFPELMEMSASELEVAFTEAYDMNRRHNSPTIPACTDPDCAEGVALGAAFCLPSLAVFGWGYFVCAAGVVASGIHCCYR